MARPRNLPDPFDTGTFAVREAKGAKVPMSSLRGLANPYRGVRAHVAPATIGERFAALSLVRRPGMVLSHCSAALVHKLPVPRGCEHDELHVTVAGARPCRPGVIAHRRARTPVTVRGLPVTSLADTWIDLAPHLGLDDLVVLGDAVAKRLDGTEELRARVDRRVPGVLTARAALEWIRVGSASPMETRSRVMFVRAGLPEPELNGELYDLEGGWIANGDLLWREARVVGEYQGAYHFDDYAQGDSDMTRRHVIKEGQWEYIDFAKGDYYRRPRRLNLVRRLAAEIGCTLDPEGLAAITQEPGLPGVPLRPCGGTRPGPLRST